MVVLKYFLALISILVIVQSQSQVLEDLNAPTMPAATIIGTQINEISKPKSLKALETALFNNFLDSNINFLIPNNYAIELDPFMFTKRTNFDYMEYLDDSIKHNLWRNLSFSVASTNNYIINDTIRSTALGFGGRTIIINGKVNEELERAYVDIVNYYSVLKDAESGIRTMIEQYCKDTVSFDLDSLENFLLSTPLFMNNRDTVIITEVFRELPEDATRKNIEDKFVTIFKEKWSSGALEEYSRLINDVISERFGWRWEIDAAIAINFPTNEFDYSVVPKFGIWSNISYKPFKNKVFKKENFKVPGNFEFIGLVRWINNDEDYINNYNPVDTIQFSAGSNFDVGMRAIYEIKGFTAEFELMYRLSQNKENIVVNGEEYSRTINEDTYKVLLNINYNINNNIILSYNLGKNFEMINGSSGNLISGFSINFGFGGAKKEDLIKSAMKKTGLPMTN